MIPGRPPRPPDKRKAGTSNTTAGLPNGPLGERASKKHSTSTSKPYIVVVDSPTRAVTWGAFADHAMAERTRAQLAKWGMAARIIDTRGPR